MVIDLNLTFTAKETQAITGSGIEPMQTWAKRGFLTAEQHRVGSAHKRSYSLENLFEIQFLLYATENGIRIELARQLLDNVMSRARKLLAAKAMGEAAVAPQYWIVDLKRSINPIIAQISAEPFSHLRGFGDGPFDPEEMPPIAVIIAIDQIITRVIDRAREVKAT